MTLPLGGRAGFDRVGGSRLTGLGAGSLALLAVGLQLATSATDRQVLVLLWAALLVAFLIGAAWPLLAVRRIEVAATSPRDAMVGDEVDISLSLRGGATPCEVRALDPTGPWHRAVPPLDGTVTHLADRRGLFQILRVEVRVTAPLGILSARRVHRVVLPHAVEVSPRPLQVDWRPAPAPVASGGEHGLGHRPEGDLVRSVRPYVLGDPARLVHWPTSARTGQLVVRELEPPVPVGQAIVVDLRDLGGETERAAAYALGAAWAVLAAGGELVLCTAEADGPVAGRVRTRIDADRRLARAVPGEPGRPPAGWPVVEIGR
ncbi:MAG: DUF58 domain-containing protein [Acidimicrobiales bacterium]|nr:DUF58 domain-containing protein [Acidimicrobiales bacterium]HRW37683.1 DUF58 domain-containing protein [Aquihabitans sp.]